MNALAKSTTNDRASDLPPTGHSATEALDRVSRVDSDGPAAEGTSTASTWDPSQVHELGLVTQHCTPSIDSHSGDLLRELEKRQDEVLERLEELDNQVCEVLRGLGVTLDEDLEEQTGDRSVSEGESGAIGRAA